MSVCTTLLPGAFIEEFKGGIQEYSSLEVVGKTLSSLTLFWLPFYHDTPVPDRRGDGWFASNAASGVIDFAGFEKRMPALAKTCTKKLAS